MIEDPEKIVAAMRERQEEYLAAGRKTWLVAAEAFEQSLGSLADAHENLAETSQVDWLMRRLRARAAFTREVGGASGRFARELLDA